MLVAFLHQTLLDLCVGFLDGLDVWVLIQLEMIYCPLEVNGFHAVLDVDLVIHLSSHRDCHLLRLLLIFDLGDLLLHLHVCFGFHLELFAVHPLVFVT